MRKELSPKAKALLDGADWIEQHGWNQGPPYLSADGLHCWQTAHSACAIGSIRVVTGEPAYRILGDDIYSELVNFNEAEGRTKEEVITYMRELALTA